jgi:hypothetical protein
MWPRSRSTMTVPGGTSMTRSSALRPVQLELPPWPPRGARQCLRCTRAARLSAPATARTITDPPSPPAVRPAFGDVLLAPEAATAVAAVAAFDEQGHTIDEHRETGVRDTVIDPLDWHSTGDKGESVRTGPIRIRSRIRGVGAGERIRTHANASERILLGRENP